MRVWDLTSNQEARLLPADRVPVHTVAFSPDGRFLAAGGGWPDRFGFKHDKNSWAPERGPIPPEKADLRVWDMQKGQASAPLKGHARGITCVAFARDGARNLLASASHDGVVKVWEVAPDREPPEVCAIPPQAGPVHAVALSRDGKLLATAGQDGVVRLWNTANGKPVNELAGHKTAVYALAFNKDGSRLASGDLNGEVRVWDPATGKEARPPLRHAGQVTGLAFADRDASRLATVSMDKLVKVWDLGKNEPIYPPGKEHAGTVTGVAFSPDDKRLATTSVDGRVIVWDAETGHDVLTLTANGVGVAFSPDGQRLAVADYAGSANVYDSKADADAAKADGK